MDIRKVKKLIELLEESNIAEIEIHEGEESVRISRMSTTLPAQAVVQAAPAVAAPAAAAAPQEAAAAEPATHEGHAVTSPMVGSDFTNGRHFLRGGIAGCQAFCAGGAAGQCRGYPLYCRGHENA